MVCLSTKSLNICNFYTQMGVSISMRAHAYMLIFVHFCVYFSIHIYFSINWHIIDPSLNIHVCACVYIYIYIYIWVCMYIYVFVYVYNYSLIFKLIAAWIAWPDLSYHSRRFHPIIFSSVCLFFIYRINIATIMKYMFSICFIGDLHESDSFGVFWRPPAPGNNNTISTFLF